MVITWINSNKILYKELESAILKCKSGGSHSSVIGPLGLCDTDPNNTSMPFFLESPIQIATRPYRFSLPVRFSDCVLPSELHAVLTPNHETKSQINCFNHPTLKELSGPFVWWFLLLSRPLRRSTGTEHLQSRPGPRARDQHGMKFSGPSPADMKKIDPAWPVIKVKISTRPAEKNYWPGVTWYNS